MARASVLKRQRERKRDEKAARKREDRASRGASPVDPAVATADDLAGYGIDATSPGSDARDDLDDEPGG